MMQELRRHVSSGQAFWGVLCAQLAFKPTAQPIENLTIAAAADLGFLNKAKWGLTFNLGF